MSYASIRYSPHAWRTPQKPYASCLFCRSHTWQSRCKDAHGQQERPCRSSKLLAPQTCHRFQQRHSRRRGTHSEEKPVSRNSGCRAYRHSNTCQPFLRHGKSIIARRLGEQQAHRRKKLSGTICQFKWNVAPRHQCHQRNDCSFRHPTSKCSR